MAQGTPPGSFNLRAAAFYTPSKLYLLGHGLTMLVAKVPIRFHRQRTTVLVAQPARDRGNINAALAAETRDR